MKVFVYTDGSCKGNPGKGGWGWIEYFYNPDVKLQLNNHIPLISFSDFGGDKLTTNNRMEIYAVINYLKNAPYNRTMIIHSDSQYLLKSLIKERLPCNLFLSKNKKTVEYTGWMNGWKKKNFKDVKNVDLWKELDIYITLHLKNKSILEFNYVKGHSVSVGNSYADKLANLGSDLYKF